MAQRRVGSLSLLMLRLLLAEEVGIIQKHHNYLYRATMHFFRATKPTVFDWPNQLIDLNPTELEINCKKPEYRKADQ